MIAPSDPADILSDIQDSGGYLTTWEDEFIESIGDQLDEGRDLSDRQVEVLTNIWHKVYKR